LWVYGAARDVIQAPKLEPWVGRYELRDFERAAIEPFLPNNAERLLRQFASVGKSRYSTGKSWKVDNNMRGCLRVGVEAIEDI
jgi:hypothetical protein